MKFWEAMRLLQDGKKVRCHDWAEGQFTSLEELRNHEDFPFRCDDVDQEWELYEEPEKQMTFQEAIVALKCGKKVKRKCWDKIIRKSNEYGIIFSSDIEPCIFSIDDFEANDWICINDPS